MYVRTGAYCCGLWRRACRQTGTSSSCLSIFYIRKGSFQKREVHGCPLLCSTVMYGAEGTVAFHLHREIAAPPFAPPPYAVVRRNECSQLALISRWSANWPLHRLRFFSPFPFAPLLSVVASLSAQIASHHQIVSINSIILLISHSIRLYIGPSIQFVSLASWTVSLTRHWSSGQLMAVDSLLFPFHHAYRADQGTDLLPPGGYSASKETVLVQLLVVHMYWKLFET